MPDIASSLFNKCALSIGNGSELCGGFTLCDISPTTDDELASIYKDGSGRGRIIGNLLTPDFMGRACQIKQNGLYDLLMERSRIWTPKRLGQKPIKRDLIEVMPFVEMGRKGPINNNYWKVANGAASAGSGPNTGTAYTHVFELDTQTNIPADVRWFPPRTEVYISGKSSGGSSTRTQWTVVDSEKIDSDTVRIYCVSVNAASSLPAAKLEVPEIGIASRGVPNVNPYEKYCTQPPGLNTNQRALFWVQDTRHTLCVDDMTEKYIKLLRENNPLYREFGDVDSVELNRQLTEDYQRRMVETFFWQKPLANQTATDWDQLELINTLGDDTFSNYVYLPGIDGRCVGRRANAVGIYEQLAECDRVLDLQGEVLNIAELQRILYTMKRTRESNGLPGNMIEIMTDSWYFVQLKQGFFNYLQARFNGALRANMDVMAKTTVLPTGFKYVDFELDYPAGLTLRIVTHPFFDDYIDAHTEVDASLADVGRMLWILEANTNYLGIVDSESVTLRTGDIKRLAEVNEDALCRMKTIGKSVRHTSTKFAVVNECPGASLIIENIASDVPEHRGESGVATDAYGAYSGS